MTIHDCYGEYPPLTADLLQTAPRTVDSPLPAQSSPGGFQHTICTLVAEIDELHAENRRLADALATARQARDTAQTQLVHYRRQGL